VAGLLFALHPASHEVVYWIAARFDLLATFFALLALALLTRPEQRWRVAGTLAFGLALLAKESAISLLIIAPAWDVVVDRRDFRTTARRLLPLLAVLVAYIAIRSVGAELDATVGSRRLPKAVMMLVGLAVVLWIAWVRGSRVRGFSGPQVLGFSGSRVLRVLGCSAVIVALGLAVAPHWVFEKLGFVTHVVFYAVSPVIFPAPRAEWFNPASVVGSLPHLVLLALIGLLAWSLTRSTESDNRRDLGFAVLFIAAALLPVSSMTGGLRYLYLPTVGVALLGAALLSRMSKHAQLIAAAAVAVMLVISAQQIVHAGRAWRTASTVTREGVELMAGSLGRCGSDDVLAVHDASGDRQYLREPFLGRVRRARQLHAAEFHDAASRRRIRPAGFDHEHCAGHRGTSRPELRRKHRRVQGPAELRHPGRRRRHNFARHCSRPARDVPRGIDPGLPIDDDDGGAGGEAFYYSDGRIRQ
jgi:hypothetical protein